ncbi:MAG: tetratricopeptide repeat protein, partial [Pseudomonadota bacterium]
GKRTSRDATDLSALLPGYDDRLERDGELDSLLHQYPVDDTSFDIYRTLGDAFRRRGEYSRAIGVHEHLLSSGKLGNSRRRKAILELSRDYAGAGLLDRVEALLVPLVEEDPNEKEASTHLLRLYEKQQDWQSAIDLASNSQSLPEEERNELVAQYCCEMAALRELEDDLEASEKWLKQALKDEPSCSRALLMLGRQSIELKEFEAALKYFNEVEIHHPELSPEIAESVFYALQESGDSNAMQQHLDYIRERQNSYSVIKLARDAISRLEGEKNASDFFIEQIARRPSLKGLRDWAERELEITKPRDKDKVAAMVEMLRHVVEEKPVYRCDRCGYRCKQIQWRCPGCENWNSVKVIIGAEGE